MQLIGMLDSPYVRRVAISLKRLDLPFEHRSVSVFRQMPTFSQINPLLRAPSLVCDDGTVLADSTLILEYAEHLAGPERSLMPSNAEDYRRALRLIGLALNACDKTVHAYYERTQRPPEKFHQPWFDRVQGQLNTAYQLLESAMSSRSPWLVTDQMIQPDITVAVAWRFTQLYVSDVVLAEDYPQLAAFSDEVEQTPEFVSTPLP
ncbi:MAG: glutathione S-transferase [Cyanobacteria bacterium J06632_22]